MSAVVDAKTAVTQEIGARGESLIALSHTVHALAEPAWVEHESSALLQRWLAGEGFAVEAGQAGLPTAFVASRPGDGPHIAFMAEYDALVGLGHACGHNIIAAAACGAAAALAAVAPHLRVSVIGTPAEEGGGGKILMKDAGVFDDVDFGLMIHPGPTNFLYARPYAVAHLRIAYRGRGSHAAAYPERGRNAADAFIVAQVAIGLLRQQLPDATRVHGIVTEAGTAANAIPESSVGNWYVRGRTLEELGPLVERVLDCFRAGALATGCELEVRETSPRYAEFRNDEPMAAAFDRNARALGRTFDRGTSGMNTASTDMGNVSQLVRAIHPYIGIDTDAVNHQAQFADAAVTQNADRAVLDGAILLAQTALDFAQEEDR
ncbi:M20 family metallopeptidase [Microbacterium sp. zg.B48]|uniref:M20 family metallopeptidase n=1 Tax=Microbacterium sp. zg.B48 TaxID=2969408 RepID=UPI00214BEA1B|nr:M20 family metallopeptidase [Microbacterium sp. zg.B48]MCR2764264.1 M20 family metallopeptidase [Microbacterium sp. zg.B48]